MPLTPNGHFWTEMVWNPLMMYIDWKGLVLKQNIGRYYSNLKPNIPTRDCIGSLRSQDLCKWYHTNCGLVMRSTNGLLMYNVIDTTSASIACI